jgi:hypothetical protein
MCCYTCLLKGLERRGCKNKASVEFDGVANWSYFFTWIRTTNGGCKAWRRKPTFNSISSVLTPLLPSFTDTHWDYTHTLLIYFPSI